MDAICQHLWQSRENCTAWLHEVLFAMLMEQLTVHCIPVSACSGSPGFPCIYYFVYFKRQVAAFSSMYAHETFQQLFHSVPSSTPEKKHQNWFAKIKSVVAKRIPSEEQVTSFTSLLCHWLKSWWISRMWLNSPLVDHYCSLSPSEQSGWLFNHDKSSVLIGASLSESHTSVSALHMFVHAYCLADHLQLINATLQWVQHSAVTTVI